MKTIQLITHVVDNDILNANKQKKKSGLLVRFCGVTVADLNFVLRF